MRQFFRPVTRVGRRLRAALAAVCVLLAGVSALDSRRSAARTAAAPTVPVVVSVRTLPAGRLLVAGDLQVVAWPTARRPPLSTSDPRRFAGRRLAGPIGAGEVVTALRLLGRDLTTGLGPDTVAAPVPLATDAGPLVRAGDRVDLIAVAAPDASGAAPAAGSAAQSVTSASLVLAVLEPSATGSSSDSGSVVVLAVPRTLAVRIATLGTSRLFTIVARGP